MANRILWSPDGTLFGKHVQFLRLVTLSLMMIMTIVTVIKIIIMIVLFFALLF